MSSDLKSILDLVNEHPVFKDQEISKELRAQLLEAALSQSRARESRWFGTAWSAFGTPLAVALTGLITIFGNYVFDSKMAQSQVEAQRSAEELEFQFEVVSSLMAGDVTQLERAQRLLFLVEAGVLTRLNVGKLREMATQTITDSGGDAERVAIPVLEPADSRRIRHIVLGAEPDVSLAKLRDFHLDQGWDDLGMHYRVRRDGVVETGRPVSVAPAFAAGFNTGGIAIGLSCSAWVKIQSRPDDGCEYTNAQLVAAQELVAKLAETHGVGAEQVLLRSAIRPDMSPLLEPVFAQIVSRPKG